MKRIVFTIFIILTSFSAESQKRRSTATFRHNPSLKHEVGVMGGVSNFQGDFVNDAPVDGNLLVNGFSINAVHTAHILPKTYYKNSLYHHFMLKSNFGYTKANFENSLYFNEIKPYSDYALTPTKYPSNGLLGKLTTNSSVISLNTQLEYQFGNLNNLLHINQRSRLAIKSSPYIGVGLGFNYVISKPLYDQDAINLGMNGNGYPDNYTAETIKGINKLVISNNLALGYRHKINRNYDIFAEYRLNYYLSDRVDGVNPDLKDSNSFNSIGNSALEADKSNDYNHTINIGLLYHLY